MKQSSLGVLFAAAILALLFYLSFRPASYSFVGFSRLAWESLDTCFEDVGPVGLDSVESTVTTWRENPAEGRAKCVSAEILPQGELVEIQYAGDPNRRLDNGVGVELRRGDEVRRSLPVNDFTPLNWKLLSVDLHDSIPFKLALRDRDRGARWLSARERLDFFSDRSPLGRLQHHLRQGSVQWVVLVLLSIGLAVAFSSNLFSYVERSYVALAPILAALSTVLFLHPEAFFFMDEWHLIQRFSEQGIRAAFVSHNEHFIPLSFLFYRLEMALFGDRYALYLVVSIAIHVLNALLLRAVLNRLWNKPFVGVSPGTLGALLFAVSGLHAETLQWAFLQCILLGHSCIFLAFYSALRFLETDRSRDFMGAAIAMLLAPLFYGGALILPLWIALLLLLNRSKHRLPYFVSAAIFLLSCAVYFINRQGSGHGIDQVHVAGQNIVDQIFALFHYAFLAAEYGTILRGIGVIPILDIDRMVHLLNWQDPVRISFILIGLGCALSLGMLFCALLQKQNRLQWLFCWFLGHSILLSKFLFIGIGRARLGFGQGVDMRYQYSALFGLTVILLPYFAKALEARQKRKVAVLISLYLVAQFSLNTSYEPFSVDGARARIYVEQLRDWFPRLAQYSGKHGSANGYEGQGTPLEGMQPFLYGGQSEFLTRQVPLLHPVTLYGVLRDLNPQRYPGNE